MKVSLCSVPVETGDRLFKGRSEGMAIIPKIAIVSLIKWMEKHGYSRESYDFYDIDMLYPTDEEIIAYFSEVKPTVVGLSAVVQTAYGQIKRISRLIRKVLPDSWIVMGGNLSASSEAVLMKTDVDITVMGDGEIAWVEFLDYVKTYGRIWNYNELKKISGLCFLNEKKNFYFESYGKSIPSDQIPYPDYELLKTGLRNHPEAIFNYFRDARKSGWFKLDPRSEEPHRKPNVAYIFTTKGCVGRCVFCQSFTKGYRRLSYEALDAHLVYIKEKYNVGFICVTDDDFASNKKHGYEVAKLLKNHDLLWIVLGVRCKGMTGSDIEFYKECGCSAMKFGVESGSPRVLDIMEKGFNLEDVRSTLIACAELGVYSPMAIAIGMPGETERTARETGNLIGTIAAHLGVHPKLMRIDFYYMLPLPGTVLYDYGVKVGVIDRSVEGVEEYLLRVSSAGTFKRYYINLNGAPISEVLFWDYLIMFEASRVYREKKKHIIPRRPDLAKTISRIYEMQVANNPSFKLRFHALKFTYISIYLDRIVQGSKIFDSLPRWLAYGVAKALLYLEYLIQKRFPENVCNNLFITHRNVRRINCIETQHDNPRKKSLREVITELFGEAKEESSSPMERMRDLLAIGR